MKPSLSGRADLIRALAENASWSPLAAAVLGYEETPEARSTPTVTTGAPSPGSRTMMPAQEGALYEPPDVPFWRLETCDAVALEAPRPERRRLNTAAPRWRWRGESMPGFTPLAPKRVVLTRLRRVADMRRATRAIDVPAVVERLSRGRLLDDMPLRQRRAWGSHIHIIEDRARRLTPYWLDQEYVTEILQQLYPPHGVTVARLGDGETEPVIRWPKDQRGRYEPPLPGAMVLVLGDLGCLASEGERLQRFWLQWGRRLRDCHIPAVALTPGPSKDLPRDLTRVWTVVRWDAASSVMSDITPDDAVARLLALLSPAVRVEPSLLRAVRLLLPEGRGDAGLEARFWRHDAVASPHSEAATIEPEQRKAYRLRFAQEDEAVRRQVLSEIRQRRFNLHEAIWFEEVLGLDAQSQQWVDPEDVEDAEIFSTEFAELLKKAGSESLSPGTASWILRLAERLPAEAWRRYPGIQRMYDLVRPRDVDSPVPSGYDPAAVSPTTQPVRRLTLWQTADRLLLQPADAPAAPRGSPLGAVQTASGEVMIAPGQREPSMHAFWQSGQSPAWAHRWGRDAFGPWVTFRIGEVEQRLRWMPAGYFMMGSPEDEEGRYEDEGPQRQVTLSQGFWLFDTPCTQALWQAVMDDNPSGFQGENRPVERVSWEDCQAFIAKLNQQLPDLDLGLPTEAQWEYACRAGTAAARYDEDLNAIAWYDDNSGNETHGVGLKRSNAWGLYDMLGNVWEWCQDYPDDRLRAELESLGATEAGARRVFRGGSWVSSALLARAAYRYAYPPDDRDDYLGFRCSSSDRNEPARGGGPWSESEQKAEPAGNGPRRPAARLLRLQDAPRLATALPESEGFRVNTDRDRLYVARITKPPWASEIGRDGYGLWTMLDVNGVRQRLRWIPPGRFWMGSPEDDLEAVAREKPQHEVLLSRGFWLFDTPCTQALWQAVMGDNPSGFKGENRPVENVGWDDCQHFIERLNQRYAGLNLGLPTEAEWEYACRADTETPRYADDLDAIAWYSRNSSHSTHDVGKKVANAWGLHDMLGNVNEWCHDARRTYHSTAVVDPMDSLEAGARRVLRGGCWFYSAQNVRAAYRLVYSPVNRGDVLGFRCSSSGQASRQASGEATASDRSSARPEAQPTDAGRRR